MTIRDPRGVVNPDRLRRRQPGLVSSDPEDALCGTDRTVMLNDRIGRTHIRAAGMTVTARRARAVAAEALPRLEATLAGRFAVRLVELRVVDRALALSSKLFVAILPLAILSSSLLTGQSFGDELVARFGLTGAGAHAAHVLFASPSQVQSSIGLLGGLILVSSVLSFARALEAVYLDCWRLPPSPSGALKRRLAWLGGLCVYTALLSPLRSLLTDPLGQRLVAAAGAAALFLWTPYVLLGRRVAWRRLAPTAAITGASILIMGVGSAIALPRMLTNSTEHYGLIGFAFSIVSYLFVVAAVVIAAAALGSLLDERRSPVPYEAAPPGRV
jgi:membrane protein